MVSGIFGHQQVRPIVAAVRSVPVPARPVTETPPPPPEPFVTISREAGAGAWGLARQVAESLNHAQPSGRSWTCWDRELLQKVAAEEHVPIEALEAMGEVHHTIVADFLESLSFNDATRLTDEARLYARVIATIRKLAEAGRAVIVGRGGALVTRHLPGGIHIRLVAPFEHRVRQMAEKLGVNERTAADRVRQMQRNREAFYHRYWPAYSFHPDNFALTINTAVVPVDLAVDMITLLVHQHQPAPVPTPQLVLSSDAGGI